jgi:prevent-host-death family protein
MKIAPVADVKARLSAYIDECESKGPVVITRNGKPVVVMIAPEDEEDLERMVLARSPRFQAMMEKATQRLEQGKGLSHAAFWKAVQTRHKKAPRPSAANRRSSTNT